MPSKKRPPTFVSLTITGGGSVTVDQTLALSAIARFSDGSTQNWTSKATWTSLPPSLGIFTAPGQYLAQTAGTAQVEASTPMGMTTASFTVMPPVVVTPPPTGRTLLTINDLTYQGMYAFPPTGDATPAGPGTTSYASGALAVRYVGGQRRFLMPLFTQLDPATGAIFGDLVEWAAPAAAPYTGSNPTQAPTLVETRRWANWSLIANYPTWQETTSGMRVGGLWWDEAQGLLWYQLYGYYSGNNQPVLGATRLLDTVTSGNYRAVGGQYGPWWYRDNNALDKTNLFWKAVCNWVIPIPSDQQATLQGRNTIIGGTVGAVGGAGNIGPGFTAITLPPTTDPPNTVIPLGLRLADYTYSGSPIVPSPAAHRDTNYQFDGVPHTASESGLYPPNATNGFWQMSLDQVNSFIWVETPTKEGILLFGRQSIGMDWYGYNPRSLTPGYPVGWPDALDPTRGVGPGNGYGASIWKAALYLFDPAQVREVAGGIRSPFSDGINPTTIGDWHVQWPNLPYNQYLADPSATQCRPIESLISNSGYFDAGPSQVIWIQPTSVGRNNPQPTLNLFGV